MIKLIDKSSSIIFSNEINKNDLKNIVNMALAWVI